MNVNSNTVAMTVSPRFMVVYAKSATNTQKSLLGHSKLLWKWYYLNWQDIAGYAMLGGNIYTPKLPDNAQGLPKPLTDSIYPESHLNKNSVWRLDLEFETKEEAVAVLEALSGKIFES